MIKEQFENVIEELYDLGATKKAFAKIGMGENDCYLIIRDDVDLFQVHEKGIMIRHGRNYFYLPFETIIAIEAEQ